MSRPPKDLTPEEMVKNHQIQKLRNEIFYSECPEKKLTKKSGEMRKEYSILRMGKTDDTQDEEIGWLNKLKDLREKIILEEK